MTNIKADVFTRINTHDGDRTVCWEWKLSLHKGRPYYKYVNDAGIQQKQLAYRVVYELVNGVVLTPKQFVLHQCDNPACCNPYEGHANIIGTHQENMDDMKSRERHGLSHHMVKAIKNLLQQNKLTHKEIADITGVSRQLITEINRGTIYKHVEGEGSDE